MLDREIVLIENQNEFIELKKHFKFNCELWAHDDDGEGYFYPAALIVNSDEVQDFINPDAMSLEDAIASKG